MSVRILVGDCLDVLRTLPGGTFQTCVTSPPYYGLRDYGTEGQIGLEETPEAYVSRLVEVFREVRRTLRDDGTLWLNLGDSYAGSWGAQGRQGASGQMATRSVISARQISAHPRKQSRTGSTLHMAGIKPKDLMGIPWMVAFALRADGWWLRQDIIWSKPNPMPESVQDRCTKAHEYVFLLSKEDRYAFHADAIREKSSEPRGPGNIRPVRSLPGERDSSDNANLRGSLHKIGAREERNARSVWPITTKPFTEAHFATMPPDLAERCVLAGSREGDAVLDPFGGAGTTALAADRLGRDATLIELNPAYAEIARNRIQEDAGMLAVIA